MNATPVASAVDLDWPVCPHCGCMVGSMHGLEACTQAPLLVICERCEGTFTLRMCMATVKFEVTP